MMSMPPGPPLAPLNDDPDDDGPDRRSDEADPDTAAAEALGYADPEDAPIADLDARDRPTDDAPDAARRGDSA